MDVSRTKKDAEASILLIFRIQWISADLYLERETRRALGGLLFGLSEFNFITLMQEYLMVYLFITGFKHEKTNGGYRLYPPPAPPRQRNDRTHSEQPPEQGALTHKRNRR